MTQKNRGNNRQSRIPTRLLRDIYISRKDDIQCDKAAIDMALSSEAGLTDAQSQQRYPALWRHFQICPSCYEEYQLLMQLTRLETANQLARPPRIPAMPIVIVPLQERLKDAITALFAGFSPLAAEAIRRGVTTGTAPKRVWLVEGKLAIVLDIEINEDEEREAAEQHYDLFCTIETEDAVIKAAFEASPIWLEMGNSGALVQEQTLDVRGKATFIDIAPGNYLLQIHLAAQHYAVLNFNIPEGEHRI